MELNLKSVVYTTNNFKKSSNSSSQQVFLKDALQVSKDPEKFRELLTVKTVADVYKTLDKISMRKEYHAALSRRGISFDYLIGGLKTVIENGEKDGDRVKALQILLKSVGVDKYDESSGAGVGTWEETLLKTIEEKGTKQLKASTSGEYEVIRPVMPESVVKQRKEEEEIMRTMYDTNGNTPRPTTGPEVLPRELL